QVGIQEVRRAPVDPEFEMAEVACVSMEKAQRLEWVVENIAADVEDGKALPIGQHTRGAARRERGSENVKVGADLEYVARPTLADAVLPVGASGLDASAFHKPDSEALSIERTIEAGR